MKRGATEEGRKFPDRGVREPEALHPPGKSCPGGVGVEATLEDIIFASSFFNWLHQLVPILA